MSRRTAQTLILFVDNEFGVLTRVTALFRRQGWNIKSLAVAETQNPAVSRLTITVECIDTTMPAMLDRLKKLACVRGVSSYSHQAHISRELVLVSLGSGSAGQARKAAEAAGARVIGPAEGGSLAVEFTGTPENADGLLAALKPFGVINVARSGVVALERPDVEEKK